MKGQNLRVLVHDECVAGSVSANLSLSAQTENSTTNDTTGDFDEIEVTGKSWEITTEALYFAGMSYYNLLDTFSNVGIDQMIYLINSELIEIPAGSKLIVHNTSPNDTVVITNPGNTSVIESSGRGDDLVYYNNTDQEINVHVGHSLPHEFVQAYEVSVWENTAHIAESFIYEYMHHEEQVFVRLAITTGEKNREVVDDVVDGYGYVTELTFNATNRQRPSFTAKITGSGELV